MLARLAALNGELTPRRIRLVSAALLLTFSSAYGQTFFISLFGAEIRATHGLSHGDFGLCYTVATTMSALLLVRAGQLADTMDTVRLALAVAAGLAGACLIMAFAPNVALLLVALFTLRFFGQGMMSHVAMTTTARWFNAFRGRALGIVALGYPLGEAVLPSVVAMLLLVIAWQTVWVIAAAVLVLVTLPLTLALMRGQPHPRSADDTVLQSELAAAGVGGVGGTERAVRSRNRGDVYPRPVLLVHRAGRARAVVHPDRVLFSPGPYR